MKRVNYTLAVWAHPHADVKWYAVGGPFGRIGATYFRTRGPASTDLLRREALESGVSEDRGERGGKSEAVRQHELVACLTELMAKIGVAVQHLAEDGIR
jgi:hypothetical protein